VGIVPAVRASRGNLSAILHAGGRGVVGGKNRLRSTLVVVQVAGSLMLLIIAGLFTRSLARAQRSDLGFKPDHVLNLIMDPNEIGYNQVQTRDFYKNLLQRVRALPGVISASTANSTPMGYYNNYDGSLAIEGYQPPPGQTAPAAFYNTVSTDYFPTMGISLLRGRTFTETDDENTQYVAIVSEDLPSVDNRVSLDPTLTDSDGIPAPRIEYRREQNNLDLLSWHSDRAREALQAAGATHVLVDPIMPEQPGHLLGTARMGDDRATSVVDQFGRAHDVPNLFVVDGSIFVTGGGVNPTNTICALALRCAAEIVRAANLQPVPA